MLPETPVTDIQSSTELTACIAFVSFSIAPVTMAIDGARVVLHKADLARLGLGFSGSIRESSCAVESDRVKILASIGDASISVDQSIHVLLQSGMSTASMRKGASLGIAVERLSFVQLGPALCLWASWAVFCLGLFRPGLLQLESLADAVSWQAAQSIYPAIHLVTFAVSPYDNKTFIVHVAHKLLLWLVALDGLHQMLLNSPALFQPTAILYNVFGLLSSLICAMGLGNLVSVPLVGKHCARLLIGRAPPVDIRRVPVSTGGVSVNM